MGIKLAKYYQYVTSEAGLKGKIALAQETKVPSTKAALEPDSAELLARFATAVAKITGKPAPTL